MPLASGILVLPDSQEEEQPCIRCSSCANVCPAGLVPYQIEYPRTQIPDGWLVMGSPAKLKRELTDEEIQTNHENALTYQKLKEGYR